MKKDFLIIFFFLFFRASSRKFNLTCGECKSGLCSSGEKCYYLTGTDEGKTIDEEICAGNSTCSLTGFKEINTVKCDKDV